MSLPALDLQGLSTEKTTTAAPGSPDLVDLDDYQKSSQTDSETQIDVPRPTRLQRHLLLLAIRLVGKLRSHDGSVLMLTKDLCVKYGSITSLLALQDVRERSTLGNLGIHGLQVTVSRVVGVAAAAKFECLKPLSAVPQ
jgi:hypothetical protein